MFEGINYSQKEIAFYDYLFENNKNPNNDFIEGKEVAQLFMKANLQRDKLKIIWDNSSKRKAQNLSKEEFYYSCRSVALAQMEMELNDYNVKQMNNSHFLPVFNGIQSTPSAIKPAQPIVHQQQPLNNVNKIKQSSINSSNAKPSVSIPINSNGNMTEDDEFVTIDENIDKEIKPHESIKQVELNIVNSLLKDFDVNKHKKEKEKEDQKPIAKPISQPLVEEFKPKKNLDDLLNLLETNDDKAKNEEEEFITIEEEEHNQESNEINKSLKENESNNNKPMNQEDSGIMKSNNILNNNQTSHTPQLINSQSNQVIPSNDLNMNMNILNEKKESESNEIKIKADAYSSITPVVTKSKTMNLDDIMSDLDFGLNKEPLSMKDDINDIKQGTIYQQKTVELKNNQIKEDLDNDDDFREVVEEEDQQNHDISTKNENEHPSTIHATLNVNLEPIDSIINTLKPNQYETGIQKETKEELSQETINKSNVKEKEAKEDQIIENNEIKKEEKKPTYSILNFTQMDFLKEFTKEINPNLAQDQEQEQEKEDEFEFLEVDEQQNTKQPKSNNESIKQLDPVEEKLSKNFKSDELKAKFHSNLILIFQAINKEYSIMIPLLKELLPLGELKVSDGTIVKNKRLINFINGIIRLLLFNNKFNGTKEFIKNSKLETNRKYYDEIVSLIKTLSNSKNFASVVDRNKLNELNNIPKIQLRDNDENRKDCQLCLHSDLNEKITNVFGYDFHIRCINVWLNLISAKSPFIQ